MKAPTFFAYDPADPAEVRVEKSATLLVAGLCCVAGLGWSGMYFAIFGTGSIALLPLLFVGVVGSALVLSHLTGNHYYAINAQLVCIIFVPAVIQWRIGGISASGLVIVWGFVAPMTALMFFSVRKSLFWFLTFAVTLVVSVAFDGSFAARAEPVPASTSQLLFFMNLGIAAVVVFVFAGYFVRSAIDARDKADRLLLNVLPKEVAPILKDGTQSFAQHFESASVLFADIVGSTPLFSDLEPAEALDWLHEIFSGFDELAARYGLEKIRTTGDSYMIAAGVPVARKDHAAAIANLAIDMMERLKSISSHKGKNIQFRMGINSGPLVAGVIGQTKFHYDLYGDAVNTASRMESHGEPGKIHVTRATYELLGDEFTFEPRGRIPIKGKGEMETYFLLGRSP